MLKYVALILMMSSQITAAAAQSSVTGRITDVLSYTGHSGLLVALDAPYDVSQSCGGAHWYIMPDTMPRIAFLQSLILTAQGAKKSVALTISGCLENYPKVLHVTYSAQ